MIKLVLIRHGQSIWRIDNKFIGWTDVELSPNGIKEAINEGNILKKCFTFDVTYTSVLKMTEDTLKYVLEQLNEENIVINYNWKLNERCYWAIQGLNKDETRKNIE